MIIKNVTIACLDRLIASLVAPASCRLFGMADAEGNLLVLGFGNVNMNGIIPEGSDANIATVLIDVFGGLVAPIGCAVTSNSFYKEGLIEAAKVVGVHIALEIDEDKDTRLYMVTNEQPFRRGLRDSKLPVWRFTV